MSSTTKGSLQKTAVLSDDGVYRYFLSRTWSDGGGPLFGFVGVNPSTADADAEDATTRKWRGFVERWGGKGYLTTNLFAYRATDVRELSRADDPFGPLNADYMEKMCREVDVVVPCWGSAGKLPRELRWVCDYTISWLRTQGKPIKHLGLTADGQPRHPLMLAYSTPLEDQQ